MFWMNFRTKSFFIVFLASFWVFPASQIFAQSDEETPSFAKRWDKIWSAEDEKYTDQVQATINLCFEDIVKFLEGILFYQVPVGFDQKMPVVLLILVFGGIFFTFRFGFANIRLFGHCIAVIRGKFDKEDDEGEVTHFQALTSALSATVGLGNIAGVAAAIAMGGSGAVFWMWFCAFFGMSSKFSSCSLAQLYRRVKPDGSVLGGPMVFLEDGIKERFPTLAPLGKIFGILFAVFTVFAAFGGGNMFQGNQTFKILSDEFSIPQENAWIFGLIMAIAVGAVIIGGIRRIGEVTSKLVPTMCGFYCIVCILILARNIANVPDMFLSIFTNAFSHEAGFGGLLGYAIMQGIRRAAFSNEAGLGSAAIAHAAAKTDEPVREGIVAMIGPFIDTIVVCTMTALTILVTNSHVDPATQLPFADVDNDKGIELTSAAFGTLHGFAPKLLCVAVVIFAYSTMISWSYYGEKAIEYLFGPRGIKPYRFVFVIFVVFGPILSLSTVLGFSDMMLFSMAFPNILGMVMLSGLVLARLRDYQGRLASGEMKPQK